MISTSDNWITRPTSYTIHNLYRRNVASAIIEKQHGSFKRGPHVYEFEGRFTVKFYSKTDSIMSLIYYEAME